MPDVMTDEDFLCYVELHSRTPLALFHADHVNRLLVLAGEKPLNLKGFAAMHADYADPLVDKARDRAKG